MLSNHERLMLFESERLLWVNAGQWVDARTNNLIEVYMAEMVDDLAKLQHLYSELQSASGDKDSDSDDLWRFKRQIRSLLNVANGRPPLPPAGDRRKMA